MKRPRRILIAAPAAVCLVLWFYLAANAPKPLELGAPSKVSAHSLSQQPPSPLAPPIGSISTSEQPGRNSLPPTASFTLRPKLPPLTADKLSHLTKAYVQYSEMKRASESALKELQEKDQEIRRVVEMKIYTAEGPLRVIAIIHALQDPDMKDALSGMLQDPVAVQQFCEQFQMASDQFNLGITFSKSDSAEQLLSSVASMEDFCQQRFAKISEKLAIDDDLNNTLIQHTSGEVFSGLVEEYMSSHGYKFNQDTSAFTIAR